MRRVPLCLPFCRRIVSNTVHMCSIIADTSAPTHNLDAVRRGHAWRLLWLPTNPAIRAAQCSIQCLLTIIADVVQKISRRVIRMPRRAGLWKRASTSRWPRGYAPLVDDAPERAHSMCSLGAAAPRLGRTRGAEGAAHWRRRWLRGRGANARVIIPTPREQGVDEEETDTGRLAGAGRSYQAGLCS